MTRRSGRWGGLASSSFEYNTCHAMQVLVLVLVLHHHLGVIRAMPCHAGTGNGTPSSTSSGVCVYMCGGGGLRGGDFTWWFGSFYEASQWQQQYLVPF